MKTKIALLLVGIVSGGAATNVLVGHFELPIAKVTLRVVDEAGQPMEDVKVSLGFGRESVSGATDARGLFSGEGRCGIAGMGSDISKPGYYFGAAPIPRFTERDELLNHWKPWNETYTTILRPIANPVALYAKSIKLQIPEPSKPCGFDLEAGDWVSPYGKGTHSDFLFRLSQEKRGVQDYDVLGELTFQNPLDGVQDALMPDVGKNSIFRWERQAPGDGYGTKFQLQNSWHKEKGITRSFKFKDGVWEGYFFRVRTVEKDGKIVSAHYGKIRGGIEVFPHDPNPKIDFTYYFNPTPNDRNLEWDTKKNLFVGLSDMETPREP